MPKKLRPLDTNPIYYCYVLFDWQAIPRWIGKGKNGRIDSHEHSSKSTNFVKNEFIEQTWIMLGEVPKLKILENLTEAQAFEAEVAFITAIGRMDQGKGPLTNITDGGEGPSGMVHTDSARRKMSENQPKEHTEEHNKAVGVGQSKRWAKLSPEERKIVASKRWANHTKSIPKPKLTTEERRVVFTKASKKKTFEEWSEISKRNWSKITPEERHEIWRLHNSEISHEARSASARNGWDKLTDEQRKERGRSMSKGWTKKRELNLPR